jgi:serine protease Do
VRYTYALATSLLLGGAAAAMTLHQPAGAQTAQNEPGAIVAEAPRPGAPMSFADMVAKLQPAVVNISTTQRVRVAANPFAGTPFELFGFGQGQQGQGAQPQTREATSLGSGFIISADGYVVTNNHVVSADGGQPGQPGGRSGATVEAITVTLADRREYKARLIGRDPLSDLALLKIDGATNLPFVRFGDSTRTRVGDWVVAIGNPFGLGGSVTAGIVSATHRVTGQGGAYDRFIQTDASINRGNSGGPMFDLNGNVIGINSQIYSPTGGNVGIGFAIPAEEAKPVIDSLMKGGPVRRGYLGIGPQPLTPDLAGAFGVPKDVGEIVRSVVPGEAAAKAGIRPGDVVVKLDGKEVNSEQSLSYLAANIAPGATVPVEIIRDGRRQTLRLTMGTRPSEDDLNSANPPDGFDGDDSGAVPNAPQGAGVGALGLSVTPITPQLARRAGVDVAEGGLVVMGVAPTSDAAEKGIRPGDVIISANSVRVATEADLARVVAAAKAAGRETIAFYVQRRENGGFVAVDVPK